MISLATILSYFKRGLYPTEAQFDETFSSFWHKSEKIPQDSIFGLQEALTQALLGLTYQAPVAEIADLATTYPSPVKGWAAMVTDVGYIYSYNGSNWQSTGIKAFPSDVLTISGDQVATGAKSFERGIDQRKGGIFRGKDTFPTGVGSYGAYYVDTVYGVRILAYDGVNYKPLKIGAKIGEKFAIVTNADGSTDFFGNVSAPNLAFNATTQAPLAEGLYHSLASAIAACVVALNKEISFLSAAYEVDTLTVTAGATADGNVVVTLNGVDFTVAVLATDNTAALVAAKMRAATYTGWMVSGTGNSVIFTNTILKTTIYPRLDVASTGILAVINVTKVGHSPQWVTYRYIGSNITNWNNISNWLQISSIKNYPYLNPQTNNTLLEAQSAIREMYIDGYDTEYDYLFTVIRRAQNLGGTYPDGRYELVVKKVIKNTTTIVDSASYIAYYIQELELNTYKILGTTFSVYILIDWAMITYSNGYGNVNRGVLLSPSVRFLENSPSIQVVLQKSNTYTKDEVYTKDETQQKINPPATIVDVSEYIQNLSYTSGGLTNPNQYYRAIVDYPITEGAMICLRGIGTASGKHAFYKDSNGNIDAATIFEVMPDTVYSLNSAYPLVCITIVGGNDVLADLNLKFYTGTSSDDFVLSEINGFPLSGGNTYTKDEVYTKTQSDDKYALIASLQEKADSSSVLLKTSADSLYAAKSTTEIQLSEHASKIAENENEIGTINSNVELISQSLSNLDGSVPNGAIAGDNEWTGANTFLQPIKGVAASADNEYIRQGEYKNTLNRFEDAADYGFSPIATAAVNTASLNAALIGGHKTLTISKPGIYRLNDTVYLDDYTTLICANGVILQKVANFTCVLLNRGALTRSYNTDITLIGLQISVNAKELFPAVTTPIYGLRGHVSFLCAKNVIVDQFKVLDIGLAQWGIHFCSFYNIKLTNFQLKGNKDGVHLGRGSKFIISNGVCETFDDAIALNAHDYPSCNPEVGDITYGEISNVKDVRKSSTSGYFSRILVGRLIDWYLGIEVMNGDTVVNAGRVYRAIGSQSIKWYSAVEPVSTSFTETTADGAFVWKLIQNDAVYTCNVSNITYRKILAEDLRAFLSVEYDLSGGYNRSIHPDISTDLYPSVDKIEVESSVIYEGRLSVMSYIKTGFYFRNVSKILDSTLIAINQTSTGRIILENCDLRNIISATAITTGAGVDCHIIRCQYNSSLAGIYKTGQRCNSDTNLTAFPSAPVLGDIVKKGDVLYHWNGSSWASLF